MYTKKGRAKIKTKITKNQETIKWQNKNIFNSGVGRRGRIQNKSGNNLKKKKTSKMVDLNSAISVITLLCPNEVLPWCSSVVKICMWKGNDIQKNHGHFWFKNTGRAGNRTGSWVTNQNFLIFHSIFSIIQLLPHGQNLPF